MHIILTTSENQKNNTNDGNYTTNNTLIDDWMWNIIKSFL
jgi:hypothetical protein